MFDSVKGEKADRVFRYRADDETTTALVESANTLMAESLGDDEERVSRYGNAALLPKLSSGFGELEGILPEEL